MEVSENPKLSPLNATKSQSYLDIQSVRKVLPKELIVAKELWAVSGLQTVRLWLERGQICCYGNALPWLQARKNKFQAMEKRYELETTYRSF